MSKKINAALKRAYHYFGFEEIIPYEEAEGKIEHLKGIPAEEAVVVKVNQYADEIAEYFENEKRVASTEFPVAFAKGEPRKSWEHYTDDFPEDIFDSEIESIEIEDSQAEEEEIIEDAGEMESVDDDDIEDVGEIESADEDIDYDERKIRSVVGGQVQIETKPNKSTTYSHGESF